MTVAHTRTRRERTRHDLRCFCRGNPLLGVYGVDADGSLYVHIKVFKGGRVYGEVYFTGGIAKIRCRNCLRWNKVHFVAKSPEPLAKLEETTAPPVATEK